MSNERRESSQEIHPYYKGEINVGDEITVNAPHSFSQFDKTKPFTGKVIRTFLPYGKSDFHEEITIKTELGLTQVLTRGFDIKSPENVKSKNS